MMNVDNFIQELNLINPLQNNFLIKTFRDMNSIEIESFETYLSYLENQNVSIKEICKSYNTIVQDTLREQVYFQRKGKYRYSKYSEVADKVYQNEKYMSLYMYGLAITLFIWKQHREILKWFVEVLPQTEKGHYLEIGPGHGYFFLQAMKISSFDFYQGIDISPTSVKLTQNLLDSRFYGEFNNYSIDQEDFLEFSEKNAFQAVVMNEVLEHVENPEVFLKKIFQITRPDSFIFISTAINAPAIDHLFLFNNVEEVEEICLKSGFIIEDKKVVSIYENVEQESSRKLPVNIALILRKNL